MVDGRGLSVFEIIIGADNAPNLLMAAGSGSSLYGGKGNVANTLQGGNGADTFLHTDGSALITNATTGDTLRFGAEYTGFSFSNDDVILYSNEGSVMVQGIRDQIIDIADGNGNFACHVYMASNYGDVDIRDRGGYQVISGANEISNVVYAGNEGGSLYGGKGQYDTLIGGDGADCFMFDRGGGVNVIQNAYSNDFVNLMDNTLGEITEFSATADETRISFLSGAQLTIEGNNGVGYLIEGKMYDANIESNSLVERSNQ